MKYTLFRTYPILFHYHFDGRMEAVNKPAEDLVKDARKVAQSTKTQMRVTHPYTKATGVCVYAADDRVLPPQVPGGLEAHGCHPLHDAFPPRRDKLDRS